MSEQARAAAPAADQAEALRVLLVDDHDIFRRGLRYLLEEHGLQVVAEAPTGEAGAELAERLVPDVVLMDINMPGIGGIEATRKISATTPLVRVVVLTISANEDDVVNAMLAGACGYLLKDSPVEELIAGINAAAAGESLLSPRIAGHLLRRLRSGQATSDANVGVDLSERELAVLKLIASGKDNAEIARQLFLSQKTVKNHVTSILRKLQIESRLEAAIYALKRGLV